MQPPVRVNDDRTLEGRRLLVVEDDAVLSMDLEQILRSAGAETVLLCRNVAEALTALANNRISAAVLDFRIGHETTISVAQQLSQRGTPFIFYTGQLAGDPGLTEWPSCKVVLKPAPARRVISAITEVLSSKSAAAG